NGLAVVELVQGNYSAARSLMEEALVVYRRLGIDTFAAATLNNLGEVARYQSDYKSANGFYGESLDLFRKLGDQTGIIESLGNMGRTLHHLGNFQAARGAFLEALSLTRTINAVTRAAGVLAGLVGLIVSENDAGTRAQVNGRQIRNGVPIIAHSSDPNNPVLEHVAHLSGLVAEVLEQSGRHLEPLDQAEFDHYTATARARLGEKVFNPAGEEGRNMTIDRALEIVTRIYEHDGEAAGLAGPRGRGRPRQRSIGDLTSREYEIATLVARGMTN